MRTLAATILALVLSACGGGGPDAGACPFPGNCPGSVPGGAAPPGTGSSFTQNGTGAAVFTLPDDVSLVQVQGRTASSSQVFTVYANGILLFATAIGTGQTTTTHSGTYMVPPGAVLEVRDAANVEWTVLSTATAPPGSGLFSTEGDGASVFDLPARSSRYRIRASYQGNSAVFSVTAAGQFVVASAIGTMQPSSTADGVYLLGGGRVQVDAPSGVKWSFTEQP